MQGSPSHLTSPLYLQGDPHLVGIVTKNCPHTLFYTKIAFFSKKICVYAFFVVPLHPLSKKQAQMAESVDALVSNTSGAIRAGSTPALGT